MKTVTWLRGTGSSRGQNEGGRLGPGRPSICMLGVGAKGTGAHPGGSAGRWCAAPGPRSAAPRRPCALCPGCRSCTRRRRPAPAGPGRLLLRPPPTLPLLPPTLCPAHPTPQYLSCLLKTPAGITEESEGFGRRHLVDGRHAVPQVHSKVLCREVAVSASGHSPTPQKSARPSGPAL